MLEKIYLLTIFLSVWSNQFIIEANTLKNSQILFMFKIQHDLHSNVFVKQQRNNIENKYKIRSILDMFNETETICNNKNTITKHCIGNRSQQKEPRKNGRHDKVSDSNT